ncbi:MAG: hypothetical protein K0S40_3585 [Actinomycetospora sp.]|nr:hypothetical protein [Actinomycetospora sp.]
MNRRCGGSGTPSSAAVAAKVRARSADDDELCEPVTIARSVYPCPRRWRRTSADSAVSSTPMKSARSPGIRRLTCTNGISARRSVRMESPSSVCSEVRTIPSTRRAIMVRTTVSSVGELSRVWATNTS